VKVLGLGVGSNLVIGELKCDGDGVREGSDQSIEALDFCSSPKELWGFGLHCVENSIIFKNVVEVLVGWWW